MTFPRSLLNKDINSPGRRDSMLRTKQGSSFPNTGGQPASRAISSPSSSFSCPIPRLSRPSLPWLLTPGSLLVVLTCSSGWGLWCYQPAQRTAGVLETTLWSAPPNKKQPWQQLLHAGGTPGRLPESLQYCIFHSWLSLKPGSCLPWRRQWHPTPLLLPGKSHGWRSLVDYSPWGC